MQPGTKGPLKVVVRYDRQRNTCLEVLRDCGGVSFLVLEPGDGIVLRKQGSESFDSRYNADISYPPEKAASHFFEFTKRLGISEEAAECLSLILPHHKETIMAVAKKKASELAEKPEPKKAATKKEPVIKKAVPKLQKELPVFPKGAKITIEQSGPPLAAPKTKTVAAGVKKPSASSRFQELIMEGKFTDDEIFAKVQAEFGLDDSKRSYVSWYFKHLTKEGKNPPPLKTKGAK